MRLLAAAGVCLAIPLVALLWVTSYAKETPRVGGIPFFFWYQFLWVFITSVLTYAAHRLVLAARGERDSDDGPPPDSPGPVPGDRLDPKPGFRS
jgi:membrane protein implicated in regulation of membrane protease activity